MKTAHPWSYSRWKSFDTCPHQFHQVKVLELHPQDTETEAILYGNLFHKAAELYVSGVEELPPQFEYTRKILDKLRNRKGEKLCEQKLALKADLQPCDFFDEDAWWRGIADLTIIDGDTAYVVDYKTGASARYADKGQLELMALATFANMPGVEKIRAGLLFTVAIAFVQADYTRADIPKLWQKWLTNYSRMEKAFTTDVWNMNPSGLCRRHCPVTSCPHNGMRD